MHSIRLRAAVAAGVLALAAVPAQAAVTTVFDAANPITIPGLTGFATSGAQMNGLSVTATFSGGASQTLSWAATGANSGGVSGTGWGLSLAGDTFTAPWNFTFAQGNDLGQLTRLVLDGTDALTIFDVTSPSPGTDGSAQGLTFTTSLASTITATYSQPTRIGAAAPVGDLWQVLTIEFLNGTGPRTDWSFSQDTDNDARLNQVPEPATLGLLALGAAGIGFARRRRRD